MSFARQIYICIAMLSSLGSLLAQRERIQRMPYADHYRFYVGLQAGLNAGGLNLTNSGYRSDRGEKLYAEQSAYRLGFNVGITGGIVLYPSWELRLMPTLHLGDMQIAYTDGERVSEYQNLRNTYLNLPLQIKWASQRLNNLRPYVGVGPYVAWHFASKKGDILRHKTWDWGLMLSVGCDLYLGFVKMSPELSYSYSLGEIIQRQRPELEGDTRLRYTTALSGSRGHQITLSLHFQ